MYLITSNVKRRALAYVILKLLSRNKKNRVKLVINKKKRTCVTANPCKTKGWWRGLRIKIVLVFVVLLSKP